MPGKTNNNIFTLRREILGVLPPVRLIAKPFIQGKRWWRILQYQHSGEGKLIQGFKDIHRGERCFVIGNGPSLTPQDLDKLKDEITFGSNRIFCIYPQTQWRPTYYCSFDDRCVSQEIGRIKAGGSYDKFLNYDPGIKYGRSPEDHIYYLVFNGKFHVRPDETRMDYTLSDDIAKYATWVPSVTINAIEIAIYMGFTEIYLLGIDHQYMIQSDHKGKAHGALYRNETVQSSYFAGMNDEKGNVITSSVYDPDVATLGYKVAKRFAERRNVHIYNATRGGKLEVFERVDFDNVIAAK